MFNDFSYIKCLKNRINELKDEILEGAKVRARIIDYTDREKPSAFLLGKQSKTKKYSLIQKIILLTFLMTLK